MAFTASGLRCMVPAFGGGPAFWVYTSADARTTVEGTDYFTLGGSTYGLKLGDVMAVIYTTGYVTTIHAVSAVDADGNASINAAVLS